MEFTVQEIKDIVQEAKQAANQATVTYFNDKLGGVDKMACGFAWVNIYGVKGNTKLGRAMKKAGIQQDYTRTFQIWNPSEFGCQNIDAKVVGAEAAADVFRKFGFTAYAGSRLD